MQVYAASKPTNSSCKPDFCLNDTPEIDQTIRKDIIGKFWESQLSSLKDRNFFRPCTLSWVARPASPYLVGSISADNGIPSWNIRPCTLNWVARSASPYLVGSISADNGVPSWGTLYQNWQGKYVCQVLEDQQIKKLWSSSVSPNLFHIMYHCRSFPWTWTNDNTQQNKNST